MPTKINYVLKVYDAKIAEIKKALEGAGIKVNSILEVYKEEVPASPAGGKEEPKEAKE